MKIQAVLAHLEGLPLQLILGSGEVVSSYSIWVPLFQCCLNQHATGPLKWWRIHLFFYYIQFCGSPLLTENKSWDANKYYRLPLSSFSMKQTTHMELFPITSSLVSVVRYFFPFFLKNFPTWYQGRERGTTMCYSKKGIWNIYWLLHRCFTPPVLCFGYTLLVGFRRGGMCSQWGKSTELGVSLTTFMCLNFPQ